MPGEGKREDGRTRPTKKRGEKLEFGGGEIYFSVVRSRRRRKTLAISLQPPDSVVVKVPFRLSRPRIREAVRSKAAWILEKQKLLNKLSPPDREFLEGEELPYLGRRFRLVVLEREGLTSPVVSISGGYVKILLKRTCSDEKSRRDFIRSALMRWYSGRAEKRIPARVSLYAGKMGLPVPKVFIRAQRTRWGSCDSRDCLRFNWRLMMAPLNVLDYVVVHELCHLKHKDHAAPFWDCLQKTLPDYEARKKRLHREGLHYHL
jgi:predicted metal-dependent hydrolase